MTFNRNIKFLDDKKIDGCIPSNEKKEDSPYGKKHFTFDPVNDRYVCPSGKPVTFLGEHYDKPKKKIARMCKGQECKSCLHQKMFTKQRTGIRYI